MSARLQPCVTLFTYPKSGAGPVRRDTHAVGKRALSASTMGPVATRVARWRRIGAITAREAYFEYAARWGWRGARAAGRGSKWRIYPHGSDAPLMCDGGTYKGPRIRT